MSLTFENIGKCSQMICFCLMMIIKYL